MKPGSSRNFAEDPILAAEVERPLACFDVLPVADCDSGLLAVAIPLTANLKIEHERCASSAQNPRIFRLTSKLAGILRNSFLPH